MAVNAVRPPPNPPDPPDPSFTTNFPPLYSSKTIPPPFSFSTSPFLVPKETTVGVLSSTDSVATTPSVAHLLAAYLVLPPKSSSSLESSAQKSRSRSTTVPNPTIPATVTNPSTTPLTKTPPSPCFLVTPSPLLPHPSTASSANTYPINTGILGSPPIVPSNSTAPKVSVSVTSRALGYVVISGSQAPATEPSPTLPSKAGFNVPKEATWASRVKPTVDKTLRRLSPQSTCSSGIPRVKIPEAVFQKGAELHKDFVICRFFGRPPHHSLIQSVLNFMWGK
ncbi:hypothetical protein AALP_AA3G052100, partial [Arabis alpina]